MPDVGTAKPKNPSTVTRFAAMSALMAVALLPMAQPAVASPHEPPEAPTFSVDGGRYEESVSVRLNAAPGETIRYTTDGTIPTKASPTFAGKPIQITEDMNLTARAFKGSQPGAVSSEGYLIRNGEQPIARFMIMSDVHVGDYDGDRKRWASYFDTIKNVLGTPDAILSNGDMINDNWNGRGQDHKIVQRISSGRAWATHRSLCRTETMTQRWPNSAPGTRRSGSRTPVAVTTAPKSTEFP
ncbi:UNVERIFIED_CONTAM: hypothetical protein ABIE34_003518 [Jeotgalibacillus campisalis]